MRLLFLKPVSDEESAVAKKTRGRSLAPLSKEAGKQQRARVAALKQARSGGKGGGAKFK